jgi:ribosomal protein S17E
MYEFEIKDGYESSLTDEFEFNKDVIKDDLFDEEYELFLVKDNE